MNRQELEEKIDESMREYYENQDSNIPGRFLQSAAS